MRATRWGHNRAGLLRRRLDRGKSDPFGGLALAFLRSALIEEDGTSSHPQQIPSKHNPTRAIFLSRAQAHAQELNGLPTLFWREREFERLVP